jgi:hypothetical protein
MTDFDKLFDREVRKPDINNYYLLFLYAPFNGEYGYPIKSKTHLHKLFVLFSEAYPELGLKITPHHFGGYLAAVEVMHEQSYNSQLAIQSGNELMLTENGFVKAQNIWKNTNENIRSSLERLKNLLNDMSHNELICFVYSTVPETTINSEIIEEFKKNRYHAAISLLRKRKISITRAALVAGKPISDIQQAILK